MGWETTVFRWLGFGRYNAAPIAMVPGSVGELQLDERGHLKVVVVPAGAVAEVAFAAGAVARDAPPPPSAWWHPKGLQASATIRASAGTLYHLRGSNEGPKKRWILVFDAPAIPDEGTVPALTIPVVEGGSFVVELPRGCSFASGITWVASSTPAKLARDDEARVWLNAEHA